MPSRKQEKQAHGVVREHTFATARARERKGQGAVQTCFGSQRCMLSTITTHRHPSAVKGFARSQRLSNGCHCARLLQSKQSKTKQNKTKNKQNKQAQAVSPECVLQTTLQLHSRQLGKRCLTFSSCSCDMTQPKMNFCGLLANSRKNSRLSFASEMAARYFWI